jgi:cytochrome c2
MDVIPNKTNRVWIDPQTPGLYVGQCAEYCGLQHAGMLLRVIVHPQEEFTQWVAAQQAAAIDDPGVRGGRELFQSVACINCHTVRGTLANGIFGPDLTHLMSRATLVAGVAKNTPDNLRAWIDNPDTLKQGGGGRIINISSVHEDWPMPGNTAYCLSKGGMRMLTRTAGVELAPHNILVVGVGPGAVATPINLATMHDPALMQKLDNAIPLGRMARPEEIASVVAFLAGDGGSYMTATTVFADGGIMRSSLGL